MNKPDIEDQIEDAAKKFRDAIEASEKKNVVVLYVYTTPREANDDVVMCGFQGQSYIHALGSVELLKDMLLSGELT